MSNFEKVSNGIAKSWSTPINHKSVSPKIKFLLNEFYDAMAMKPAEVKLIKEKLVNIFTFLTTTEGRTNNNLWLVDLFVSLMMDWEVKSFSDLPESLRNLIEEMMGLHDTIKDPEVAKNFGTTPEQLLEKAQKLFV
jgi:hypothetical protein